jgi:hypothetical protein
MKEDVLLMVKRLRAMDLATCAEAADMLESMVVGAQLGTSDAADFGKGTWTFAMQPHYRVAAGEFYIVPVKR